MNAFRATLYFTLFLLLAVVSSLSSDSIASGTFVHLCGPVLAFKQAYHGCVYTLLADQHIYRVFDLYRSCQRVSFLCVTARPSGDNRVFRPLLG
ncbi:MAG: hypothetical protein GXN93_02100 [Candidatus Diapherotrites archaeon]|nr:hypothetical protein [Candidatus Diapherotrites archaeon]